MNRFLLALLFAFGIQNAHCQTTQLQKAAFAAGCFWCAQEAFEKVPGVTSVVSGYTGGKTKNPTYEQVSSGTTGHTEAVEVTFDPAKVSYDKLLDTFWVNHDPTVTDRQFCDRGSQYRPAIFVYNDEQKRLAALAKKQAAAKAKAKAKALAKAKAKAKAQANAKKTKKKR